MDAACSRSTTCSCASCRISEVVRADPTLSPADAAYFAYWSVTCARCGARTEFDPDEMHVCAACDDALTAEAEAHDLAVRDSFVLDRIQQARGKRGRRARRLIDEAIDRLIGNDR